MTNCLPKGPGKHANQGRRQVHPGETRRDPRTRGADRAATRRHAVLGIDAIGTEQWANPAFDWTYTDECLVVQVSQLGLCDWNLVFPSTRDVKKPMMTQGIEAIQNKLNEICRVQWVIS